VTALTRPTIAIIGGGFTGAAIAWHLARLGVAPASRIVVVEPRDTIGAGLAYSATDPAFRINVPAAKMSLDARDLGDFQAWLDATDAVAGDPAATLADGRVFPRRSVFGAYVADRLAPALDSGLVEHVKAAATSVERDPSGGYRIALGEKGQLQADLLILAITHPPPKPPAVLAKALDGHPRFVTDTTAAGALDSVRPRDRVLVVGTGLTGADIIASLDARGHAGPILAISRRGLRSRGHAPAAYPARGDFTSRPAPTARALLAAIRRELGVAREAGETWHSVFDALRSQGPAIWAALTVEERRRLVRHLRPFWDVHRFRIAPQVEAVLEQRLADGSLAIEAASLGAARVEGEDMVVTLMSRGGGGSSEQRFDAVLIATGPAHGRILESQPLLASVGALGLIRPDPVGLGIDTAPDASALTSSGEAVPDILIAGPLARGTFGELMGLPEVAAYAGVIAERAAEWVPSRG